MPLETTKRETLRDKYFQATFENPIKEHLKFG